MPGDYDIEYASPWVSGLVLYLFVGLLDCAIEVGRPHYRRKSYKGIGHSNILPSPRYLCPCFALVNGEGNTNVRTP